MKWACTGGGQADCMKFGSGKDECELFEGAPRNGQDGQKAAAFANETCQASVGLVKFGRNLAAENVALVVDEVLRSNNSNNHKKTASKVKSAKIHEIRPKPKFELSFEPEA